MAFYFANVFREQSEFEGELSGLMVAADNLRNLTEAARMATAAKADFVASMSHELRTPLNAVIGYSQLMLEDAQDSNDPEDVDFVADVRKIHSAGTNLLALVDDILDFSKIEANKMVSRPSVDNISRAIGVTVANLEAKVGARRYSVKCALPKDDVALRLDWDSLIKSIGHVIIGITAAGDGGVINMAVRYEQGRDLEIQIVDPVIHGRDAAVENLFDIFADTSDASSTKYGDVGISLALGQKFAELCGGNLAAKSDMAGRRTFSMKIPTLAAA
jgi:signal transduction histidine kinase